MHCCLENGAGTDDLQMIYFSVQNPLQELYVVNTNAFIRSLSSENVPLCICVTQIRVR